MFPNPLILKRLSRIPRPRARAACQQTATRCNRDVRRERGGNGRAHFPVSCRANESRDRHHDLRRGARGRAGRAGGERQSRHGAGAFRPRREALQPRVIFRTRSADFEKAYDLDPSPIFLFNIAQSHRQLGNKERALFFYRRYLEQAPNAANRDDVERRMKDLQASLQQEAELKQKPPTEVSSHVETSEHQAPNQSRRRLSRRRRRWSPPRARADDDDRRRVAGGAGPGPGFRDDFGSRANVPTMFAARLEGSYGIALPAGELAVGIDLGYARLPYTRDRDDRAPGRWRGPAATPSSGRCSRSPDISTASRRR